jgi:prepilin-type N-terminal cleavage/methylation domain-containing protein
MFVRKDRAGFTLVELLVVIAIILVLMGLTLTVLAKVYQTIDLTRTISDISKMGEACDLFKREMGRYPLSRVVLLENGNYQGALLLATGDSFQTQLLTDTIEYLQAVFPGINLSPTADSSNPGVSFHDWNGNSLLDNAPFTLEGEEAIVFWLSGMRYGATTVQRTKGLGFNTDRLFPTRNTTGARRGPFYEFDESRITYDTAHVVNASGSPGSAPGSSGGLFPVYLDVWGTPYAYFLARTGVCNNYFHQGAPAYAGRPGNPLWLNDCHRLTSVKNNPANTIFVPYWESVQSTVPLNWVYHKPERFQIISAGRDKFFGQGGRYDRRNPGAFMTNPLDFDNVSNVAEGRMVP